jgi:hypothetical protein
LLHCICPLLTQGGHDHGAIECHSFLVRCFGLPLYGAIAREALAERLGLLLLQIARTSRHCIVERIKLLNQRSTEIFVNDHPPEVPKVDIELINRPSERSLGAGEASQGPTVAAIANAFTHATSKRLRDLPLAPARVKLRFCGAYVCF